MSNSAGGPLVGQKVIYTVSAGVFYPALITAVNATNGEVRLTTFPPGGTTEDQQNVNYDGDGNKAGSWRYDSRL